MSVNTTPIFADGYHKRRRIGEGDPQCPSPQQKTHAVGAEGNRTKFAQSLGTSQFDLALAMVIWLLTVLLGGPSTNLLDCCGAETDGSQRRNHA